MDCTFEIHWQSGKNGVEGAVFQLLKGASDNIWVQGCQNRSRLLYLHTVHVIRDLPEASRTMFFLEISFRTPRERVMTDSTIC